MNDQTPTVVIVPGLRDHVAEHWQTLLTARLPKVRSVPPLEKDKLSLAARVEALEETLAGVDGPVILVAHSGGVLIVAHWAKSPRRPIQGALLATPPDFDTPLPTGYPTQEALRDNGWFPVPRTPLPFPSIVAASTNDPLGSIDRVEALAGDWDSRFVDIGAVGHLNPASGFGDWPQADEFIVALCR
ncbi:MAG: serine hydrolase family protein [Rhodocyclaceae bacterium]|nr:MAG: serine hydrolase family protein [Rhodocyclaceae bacterium]